MTMPVRVWGKIRGGSYRGYACVVRQHESADAMCHGNIRASLCQCNLDARRTPWDESSESAFADTE